MLQKKTKALFVIFLFSIDQIGQVIIVNQNSKFILNEKYLLGYFSISSYLYFPLVIFTLLFVSYKIVQAVNVKLSIGYILLFVGILSQAIDRLRYGFVIDYLNILNITVINLADLYIVLGIFVLYKTFTTKSSSNGV